MRPNPAPLILFVCTGNQIRSPIAAAIFLRRLTVAGLQDSFRVESAGTWTVPGRSDPFARLTAHRMGFDIENHRSRMIDKNILSEAHLVIVMEQGQKEALEVEYPLERSKVQLLSQLAGDPPYNVPDPSGQELASYIQTGEELLGLVNLAFDAICRFS
jgi:protein-tyrosine phosphatase